MYMMKKRPPNKSIMRQKGRVRDENTVLYQKDEVTIMMSASASYPKKFLNQSRNAQELTMISLRSVWSPRNVIFSSIYQRHLYDGNYCK